MFHISTATGFDKPGYEFIQLRNFRSCHEPITGQYERNLSAKAEKLQ